MYWYTDVSSVFNNRVHVQLDYMKLYIKYQMYILNYTLNLFMWIKAEMIFQKNILIPY